MKIKLCPSFACLLALATGAAVASEFYVAPGGADANAGTQAKPFASLERARDAVRELKKAGPLAAPVNVWLRGGVYPLVKPVVFTPADSGTATAPVTYASAPGQRAVLSGGVALAPAWAHGTNSYIGGTLINGKLAWTRTPGKPFWQLDVPQARDSQWIFNSLYVNGQSRMRARYPHYGAKELRAEGREPGGDPRQALRYFPGDVNPAWSNPTDIDVVLLCSWTPTIHRIKEIDAEKRVVRFFSSHSRAVDFWERNFRYYLSNVFEALDEPGEWYLNRHTGMLYYYPMPGEDLATAEVIAPVMKSRMVEFAGDPAAGRFVEHLHFRDLSFRHLDGDMDRYNGVYRQGHMYLDSALSARGLRHASFERCELAQLGEYAMELADGCREVTVRQCHFWDLGAGALQLGVTDLGTLKAAQGGTGENASAVSDLVIDNCCIHRLGTIWHGCYGIVNRFASRTQLTHNEIFDTHYIAIGLDARWDWKGEQYSHGTVVAYNHLHHLGLRCETDAAGVYQFGPLDTWIHHNLIHDTVAYPHGAGFAGIYLDEQSRGAVVENNLVYNVDWFAYFQHKGMDNVFRNNLGAFARDGLLGRGGLNDTWKSNYLEAVRNVYVSSNDVALTRPWVPGAKPPVLASNMYYTLAPHTALTFMGKSFAAWQAEGQDKGSVVGDPGCRNPAAFDFSLAPDAPACRLIGFVPFDAELRKAGLYGAAAWREVAQAYPPRVPTAVWTEDDFARLNAFDLNFNIMKDGDEPGVFRGAATKREGFTVTSEIAGTRGPKCLKCVDRKGLAKSFYPYLQFIPRALKRGQVTFTFAVQPPAHAPAALQVGFRGRGATTEEHGPTIAIGRDGVVKANGLAVCKIDAGVWTHFELRFDLGAKSTGSYKLAIRNRTGQTTHTVKFGHPTFTELTWLGITTPDDADGTVYLDDLSLQIAD